MSFVTQVVYWLTIILVSVHALFWLIGVVSGVRIRRIGWLSLRHISIALGDGVRLDIGKLGLNVHRPTISQPTWFTLVCSKAHLHMDLQTAQRDRGPEPAQRHPPARAPRDIEDIKRKVRKMAAKLVKLPLRWAAVSITDTTVSLEQGIKLQLGSLTARLSISSAASAAGNIHAVPGETSGIEVVVVVNTLLYALDDGPVHEIGDAALINIWAKTGGDFGLEDIGISVKMSKIDLQMDSLLEALPRLSPAPLENADEDAPPILVEELAANGQVSEAAQARAIEQKRTTLAFALLVLDNVQLHVGFLKLSYATAAVSPGGEPARMTARAKDLVLDLTRLARASPDFRMLFDHDLPYDAHQAVVTAIGATVHLQSDGAERQIVAVPMLTIASKFSTAAWLARDKAHELDNNAHLVHIDTVITSPAVDVYVEQISTLFGFARQHKRRRVEAAGEPDKSEDQKSRSAKTCGAKKRPPLPQLSISFGIHEPSVRFILPAKGQEVPAMIVGRQASLYVDVAARYDSARLYQLTSMLKLASGGLYYHSPKDERHDIVYSDGATIKLSMRAMPISQVEFSFTSESSKVHITQQEVIHCCRAISAAVLATRQMADKLEEPVVRHDTSNAPPKPLVPAWLKSANVRCRGVVLEVCGVDQQVAPDARGMHIGLAKIDLNLRRVENKATNELDDGKQRQLPVSVALYNHISGLRIHAIESDEVVNLDQAILQLPDLTFEAKCAERPGQLVLREVQLNVDLLQLGFSLFWLYAMLQAASVARSCVLPHATHDVPKPDKTSDSTLPGEQKKMSKLDITECRFDLSCKLVRVKAFLPRDTLLMLDVDHLHAYKHAVEPNARIRYIRIYVESPTRPKAWDRVLSIRDIYISREGATSMAGGQSHHVKSISVRTDAFRIRLPHQFIFYETLEALLNTVKASVQVLHRWKTGENSYVIAQEPKEPKKLPRVRFRARLATVEAEDDPFEARLGLIYRVGLAEQKMRNAREFAFDQRIASMKLEQEDDMYTVTGDLDEEFVQERQRLYEHQSKAWLLRIQHAVKFRAQRMQDLRAQVWGRDDVSQSATSHERVVDLPDRPAMFALSMLGLDLVLDSPSFPLEKLRDFMHDRGKGMPKTMQYSLLVPLSLHWKMDEARLQLKDYPLPLLHVPPLHETQRCKSAAWELTTDLVIAEQAPELTAIRRPEVCIIPKDTGRVGSPSFSVEVQRTANSVKTFADMNVSINSALPMRVHWGNSMSPAVSDMMRIFDTLSKPQADPSEKLGFWDKLRLIMHVAVKLKWPNDGAIHVTMKGTRDPYVVIGAGAGVTKVFRGNVKWNIGVAPDSRRLMEVTCDEYMLAISDFGGRQTAPAAADIDDDLLSISKLHGLHHYHLHRKEVHFQKILMKLTGDVRWTAGMAFERHCGENCDKCGGKKACREWDFEPHWLVKLVIPQYATSPDGSIRDAFKDFRSHYVHLQIAVSCKQRDGSSKQPYNTIHLSPKGFAHFFNWIHTFGGNLSLPIRTGPLFPSSDGPKKKFSHHLATLKYNLDLKPLYLSHVYKGNSDLEKHHFDMIGLKARIQSFVLDLHQRSEERIRKNPVSGKERKSSHMAMYRGQLDLEETDLRALTATYKSDLTLEASASKALKDPLNPKEAPRGAHATKYGNFDLPDEDVSWIDLDDYVELDTVLPETIPKCKIVPMAYSPKFVYDRDTTPRNDHPSDKEHPLPEQRFGFEKTHFCSMANSLGREQTFDTQKDLFRKKHKLISKELAAAQQQLDELESNSTEINGGRSSRHELEAARDRVDVLQTRHALLEDIVENLDEFIALQLEGIDSEARQTLHFDPDKSVRDNLEADALTFSNRFVVHELQMKWNNTLRNVVFRYVQCVSQRRGFSYYMSQRAVRFLSDLVEEQIRQRKEASETSSEDGEAHDEHEAAKNKEDHELQRLIKQLLEDRDEHFVVQDESEDQAGDNAQAGHQSIEDQNKQMDISDDYRAENSYLVRLILPEIQLQSEKNPNTTITLTAQAIVMRILSIMDNAVDAEDVSALVQRRFRVHLGNLQFFHAHKSDIPSSLADLSRFNSYGTKSGSFWPPWIPTESIIDFKGEPAGFNRIVERSSASAVYCKHNQLRIKANNEISKSARRLGRTESSERTDSISIYFPQVSLAANSAQYYAILTIAMDLLMYSEPLQKERNEQIEKILLAADFSDLTGAPEMVVSLQHRIRQMEECKTQMRLYASRTGSWSREDEARIEQELENCEDELFFLMKSVATAHRKTDESNNAVTAAMSWHLAAQEIIWHLIEANGKPFIDFGLSKASFQRTDNSDSSNFNTLEIEMMQGINLSKNPTFPELFAPYFGETKTVVDVRRSKMVRIYWYMLEAIGGIQVCDHFEVNLFPLRLQMEHEVGKKIFEYVFPDKAKGKQGQDAESDDDSSTSDDDSLTSEDDEASLYRAPTVHSERSVDSASSPEKKPKRGLRHSLSLGGLRNKASSSSLNGKHAERSSLRSVTQPSDKSSSRADTNGKADDDDSGSVLTRMTSSSLSVDTQGKGDKRKQDKSDDLTAMMTRANKNMSLVYVKVPSAVLSLSYKGSKTKNFVDITDFVFRMPTIEYRNKTWSYLDLAEHLKREVIRAVLAHTGSLIRDKMTHHKKSRKEPALVRQLTSYRTFVPAESGEREIMERESQDTPRYGGSALLQSAIPAHVPLSRRTDTAETISLAEHGDNGGGGGRDGPAHNGQQHGHHGLFHNAIGRHVQNLSHLARHREGLTDDGEEGTLKKTKILLGKLVPSSK